MSPKVGIVIVSYNASQAVRITLASLRQAKNENPSKVILVDNASYEIEREKIHSAFERHVQEGFLPWEYIQQDKNRGFSGGNNIGIKRCLEDPEISHICLLNSDVIVPDYWLDRLIHAQCDIVSAVTNKAESEQCVPIDYTIAMADCLDEKAESIPGFPLSQVNNYAQDWHMAWTGNLVEGEATFFCVLFARQVFENLGLLDETFFPGGYEDDDFCIRARQYGYKIHLARDIFIHHWGSASFGQLQYEYFSDRAQINLDYLENKHSIVRHRRSEKPFVSYMQDLEFAANQDGNKSLQRRFNNLYISQLSGLMKHFESEFHNLHQMMKASAQEIPIALQKQIEVADSFGDLSVVWQQITINTKDFFREGQSSPLELDERLAQFKQLIDRIWIRVECNFAMHAFLFKPKKERTPDVVEVKASSRLAAGWKRIVSLIWFALRGVDFIWKLRGIVFLGGYPYPERHSDGYFQRIQMLDNLFVDHWRIYVESVSPGGRTHWISHPQAKVLILRVIGGPFRRLIIQALALLCVLRCGRIYFHSILPFHNKHVGWLLYVPGLIKVFDVHGVVPEEFRLHDDFYNAVFYERMEEIAIRKCNVIVVVTRAMEDYLRQKYREAVRGKVVLFPMFPNYPVNLDSHPDSNQKPVVVYAGGIQKWQQVPKMIRAISQTSDLFEYRFYCPEPSKVQEMLPKAIRARITVERKTQDELLKLYPECHYGFILREDNIVNRVACPTKLVEYLAMGVVPIMDSENIGDFKAIGMQFVYLDALLANSLPNEIRRAEMAKQNLSIYERLTEVYKQGAYDIRTLIMDKHQLRGSARPDLVTRMKGLFPANTRRGLFARKLWMAIRSRKAQTQAENALLSPLPECEILVQVDNFEAGGLENITLDINEALIRAGHKVVLLVLGTAGISVQRARERGMTVLTGVQQAEWYETLLDRIRPRLVLAHYSTYGAELCSKRNIPFVQTIQNTYMWFDNNQRTVFDQAAKITTCFIALSEYAKQYSVQRLGIDESRCIVLPCGIDGAPLDNLDTMRVRQELRSQYGFDEQDFVFLSVGAINHQKNHIATVRALAGQISRVPHAKLLLLGPAYEKDLLNEILHFVEEKELGDQIIYAGAAPSALKYYAMADAFVSAAFFEGGPLNLLEALKANLPIVMTHVGLAGHFQGVSGVNIIEPAIDIMNFQGAIWELSSTPEFETRLATAMVDVYNSPQRPNLSAEILRAFDKFYAYSLYVEKIEALLQGKNLYAATSRPTWVNLLEELNKNTLKQ